MSSEGYKNGIETHFYFDFLNTRYKPTKFFVNARRAYRNSPDGLVATYQDKTGAPKTLLYHYEQNQDGSSLLAFWRARKTDEGLVADVRRTTVLVLPNEDSLVTIIRRDSGRESATNAGNEILLSEESTPQTLYDLAKDPLSFSQYCLSDQSFADEFDNIENVSFESLTGEPIMTRQLVAGEVSVV